MNSKKQSKAKIITEIIIRLLFFITMPAAFSSGFLGIKLMFTSIGAGEPINVDSMWVLILLLGFTIVSGRFFCGFVCAFGTLGDAVYAASGFIQKKLLKRKKQISIPEKPTLILQKLKYIILLVIIILCALGIYGRLSGWSPWDVFSRLMVFRLPGDGYAVGIILLVLILIGMAFKKRFFCQFLCPMGAVFSLLPVLPISKIHRDEENCIKGCSACRKNCPVNIRLGEDMLRDGECISCEKCMTICPKKNLTKPENKLLKNNVICLVIKAVLFFTLGCVVGLCRFI